MDDSAFAARLAEAQAAIERELESLLGLEPRPGEPARPKRLIEAMRYATLGGEKGSEPSWPSRRRGRLAARTKVRGARARRSNASTPIP